MPSYNEIYSKLNPEQKEAVDTIYWPMMVVAGPWTWKTQIIWARTANIILKANVNPENILITTFTDAWVVAIKQRLLSFIGQASYDVNVTTVHSFSQDVISSFPEKFTEYNAVTPIDEVDRIEVFISIFDKLLLEKKIEFLKSDYDKYYYLRTVMSKISVLKSEWVSKTSFDKSIDEQIILNEEKFANLKKVTKTSEKDKEKSEKNIWKLRETSLIFEEYNKYLREKWLYDFNDMINFVLEKLESDDELKYYYAEKYQFIMLDEYQDTNNAQNKIIDLILSGSEEKPNIMVVWDDDQSIYRFQGANIENMLWFATKYPETKYVVLDKNYRSNQEILDLSESIISENNERLSSQVESINKVLTSSNPKINSVVPRLVEVNNDILEKDFVLNKIKELVKNGESYNEIAIIARKNNEIKDWSEFLQANWIPVESKMKSNILDSDYVKKIIDYLHIIENPYIWDEKIIWILMSKLEKVNSIDVLKINKYLFDKNYVRTKKLRYFDVLSYKNIFDEIEEIEDKDSLINFRDNILDLKKDVSTLSVSLFMNKFFSKTSIISELQKNWNFGDLQDVYTFLSFVKKLNEHNKNLTLKSLLQKIELYYEHNVSVTREILRTEKKWVNILTAHGSKWLEYNSVFIPTCILWHWDTKRKNTDRIKFPINLAWNWILWKDHEQIEEDRRLFFVGITRAKENLFLTMPKWIWKNATIISQFLLDKWGYYETEVYENPEISQDIINIILSDFNDFSEKEFEYIWNFFKDYKLSPTDLNVFINDPIDFLNRVVFKYPFYDNINTIFGSVYHKTLEQFYSSYINENEFPSLESLLNSYKLNLSKQILTPDEEEILLKKWEEWLTWYYEIMKQNKREIFYLEYNFRKQNIEFSWIPLTWKIDKIELNSSWKTVIVDYKTWSKKTENVIKWNTKDWNMDMFRQLLFYRKMIEIDPNFSDNNPIIALDFCSWKNWDYSYIEVSYNEDDIMIFENELKDSWKKMTDINFWKDILNK